jgi:hypothetical protein
VSCSGYRDTQQLRIRNESQSVVRKILKNAPPFVPQSLHLSLDIQTRDAFFAYYVTSTTTCWDVLKRYYHPMDTPDHLTLAIEAVSLAYLWHHVYSDAALATARERYVSALRTINEALMKSPKEATKNTILLVSLLLDLFEKITHSEPQNKKSYTSHVNGALALARLRGLETFQEPSQFRVLSRLSGHALISCVASSSPLSDELIETRAYIAKRINTQDPRCILADLLEEYATLRIKLQRGILSNNECIAITMELDGKLQALDLDMAPSWQYSTTLLDRKSDRVFDNHFDCYPDRIVSHLRNFLRILRVMLNESLIEHYLASPMDDKYLGLIGAAHDNIKILAGEICASVTQYVDCDGAARHRLPTSETSQAPSQDPISDPDHILDHRGPVRAGHPHTPTHRLECYALIFPLYVAGRSKSVPDARPWIIEQLHYIGSHFYIRNAEVVAQLLEREADVSLWEVYAMLGSYAFGA